MPERKRVTKPVDNRLGTIRKKLQKALDKHFTPEQQEEICFFPDRESEDKYTWVFQLNPHGEKVYYLTLYKPNMTVSFYS